jgi:hypothetical protein
MFTWHANAASEFLKGSWSARRVAEATIPIQLISVAASNIAIDVAHIETEPVAANQLDNSAAGSQFEVINTLLPEPAPESPLFVVRSARLRGQDVTVVGFSPYILQAGQWHLITALQARVNAPLFNQPQFASSRDLSNQTLLDGQVNNPDAHTHAVVAPPNNPAGQPMWRITVEQLGIQRLSGKALSQAGIDLAVTQASHLRVQFQGTEIALQVTDEDGDDRIDPNDELRFYAQRPGDRWNQTDTYWLTVSDQPGLRMQVLATPLNPTTAMRTTAFAEGDWHVNAVYKSLVPGPDRDHWFAASLSNESPTVSAVLESGLPFASGNMIVTASGSTINRDTSPGVARSSPEDASNLLTINDQLGAPVAKTAHSNDSRDGASLSSGTDADWVRQFDITTTTRETYMPVQINANGASLALEDVRWVAPVTLSFGGNGATFSGVNGTWAYSLDGIPTPANIYDITDWRKPQFVEVSVDAKNSMFVASGERKFIVAGPGTLFEPKVGLRTSADLGVPLNARGIYIAPAALHDALQPLIAHRRASGWNVKIVDTQAIYDSWSYGQVSPQAIRNFLRFADSTWTYEPYAVVLVGDGNYDPLNFSGSAPPTLVPPFLADVDPYIGEVACESCFAQLDGDDPLSDKLPDIYFGRLPVKNVQELTDVVNKIIGYETAPVAPWMWRNVFIADNFREADGRMDDAGNFGGFHDRIVTMQPLGADVQRAYYDPYAPTANGLWRITNPLTARDRVLSLWNSGAAIVNFSGHGLTGQWAHTAYSSNSNITHLLNTSDAASLSNGHKLPFVMSMACLTGSFHLPTNGGNSIDEQLVLAPNGGAIGTWSSTGMGVMYSHEFMQIGFYKALWGAQPGSLTLGALTQASLMNLFQNAVCCDDPLRTYTLIGDPMTPLRVALPQHKTFAPLTVK